MTAATPNAEIALGVDRSIGLLTMSAGKITGDADLTVTAALDWRGGVIEGVSAVSNQLILDATATATLSGSDRRLRSRQWLNLGTVTWTGGDLQIYADAEFENRGVLSVDVPVSSVVRMRSDGSPQARFHNSANPGVSLNKLGQGQLDLADNLIFDNGAAVVVSAGTIRVESPGGDFGSYQVDVGASLIHAMPIGITRNLTGFPAIAGGGTLKMIGQGQLTISGSFPFTGAVEVSDGRLYFDTNAADVNFSQLLVRAPGTLDGLDNFVINGALNWEGGSITAGGPGLSLTVAAAGSATLALDDTRPGADLSGRILVNQGSFLMTSTGAIISSLTLANGADIDNQGQFEMRPNATQNMRLRCAVVDCATFFNRAGATFTLNDLSGIPAVDGSLTAFDNAGAVELVHGCGAIDAPGTDTGSYSLTGGCTLALFTRSGSERVFQPSVTIAQSGGSQFQLEGRLRLNGSGRSFTSILINPNAILYGPAAISITGNALWRGQIEGSGPSELVTITSSGVLSTGTTPGDAPTLRARRLVNQGQLIVDQSQVRLDLGAEIVNQAILRLLGSPTAGAAIRCLATPPCGSIVNNPTGSIESFSVARGPVNGLQGGIALDQRGVLAVGAGNLQLNASYSAGPASVLAVSLGAVLERTFGPLTLTAGTLTGAGSIQADLNVQSVQVEPGDTEGTLSVSGNYSDTASTVYAMVVSGGGVRGADKKAALGGTYDRLAISGQATLAGLLNVINGGYTPLPTDFFDFITFANRTGAVALGSNPYVGFNLVQTSTRVRLTEDTASICTWDGSVGDWSDPARWLNCSSGGGVPAGTPGPADSASIAAGSVNLNLPVAVANLEIAGGTLLGPNDISIVTTFTWTGGSIAAPSNSQVISLAAGAVATLSGGQKVLDSRALQIDGTANWTTGLIELQNSALIQISATGELNVNPGVAIEKIYATVGTPQIQNQGLIRKQGIRTAIFDASVNYTGDGTIDVVAGQLDMESPGVYAGDYLAGLGSELRFVRGDRTFTSFATLGGAGKLVFGDESAILSVNTVNGCFQPSSNLALRDAQLTINCPSATSFGQLSIERPGSVLEGSSAITVDGHLRWSFGTIRGTGPAQTFTVSGAATGQFDHPPLFIDPRLLSARRFNNLGSIQWTGDNATSISSGAIFENFAGASVILNVPVGGSADWLSDLAPGSKLINHGNIHVLQVNENYVDVPFDNHGIFTVTQGFSYLFQAGTDTGSYVLGAAGELAVQGPSALRTLAAGSQVSGAGRWYANTDAVVDVLGVFQPAFANANAGGVLRFNGSLPVALNNLQISGGTVAGDTEVRIKGSMAWTIGTVTGDTAGAAPLRILAGATLSTSGDVIRTLHKRKLLIEGVWNWSDGETVVPTGETALLEIAAGGVLDLSAPFGGPVLRCQSSPCTTELRVIGEVRLAGGGAALETTAPIILDGGNLNVTNGTLTLSGVQQDGGITTVSHPGVLDAGSFVLNGGALKGNGSLSANVSNVAGRVQPGNSPGILTIVGNYTQGASGILDMEYGGPTPGTDSDVLGVSGAVSLGGTLNVIQFGGYTPLPPEQFVFLASNISLSGTFAVSNVPFAGYGVTYGSLEATLAPTGAPIIVNSRVDPGTGTCDTGECTLREALAQAALVGGSQSIQFAIPAPQCTGPGGACTIALSSPLPAISSNVTIDGYTQAGASANTQAPSLGLGSNAVIKIELDGTAVSGSPPGLVFNASGATPKVQGLAIFGFGTGILSQGPGDALYTVVGNHLGLRADGSVAPGSQAVGISIQGGNISVGDGTAAGMNVISGNSAQGVSIGALPPLSSGRIRGNLIGLTRTGTAARPNGLQGIIASTTTHISGITIGGAAPDERNVISGNGQDGIRLDCTASADTCFDGARIIGNYIGPAANGSALGNGGNGVNVSAMSGGRVEIGSNSAALANKIASNGGNGVLLTHGGTGRVSVLINAIFGNGQQAIDLGGDGRTANDAGDADTGPNGLQNFPSFSSYVLAGPGNAASLAFAIDTADSGSNYPMRVDFYQAIADEPGAWLGTQTCAVSACSANLTFPGGVTLTPDDTVLAVVTDANGKSSEASFYATTTLITADGPDPSPIGTPYTVTVEVGGAPFVPLGSVAVGDAAGSSCTITLTRSAAGLSGGSCLMPSIAPVGLRTITAGYSPGSAQPFSASSDTEAHDVAAGTAPTVTTITTIAPEPSVVGEAYVVGVSVTESGTPVPVGTVLVRQLNDNNSCTITLPTQTSCSLRGSSAVTTAVRASYSGAAGFGASNSAIATHLVNRADTQLSIVSDTPDPSTVGQAVTVTVALAVVAPGSGIPTGELLITDGSASCGIVLPNLSCTFIPKATGLVTLQARYLGDANFNGSTAVAEHQILADGADLSIIKRNGLRLLPGGQPVSYTLLVSNAGPQAVVNARVTDILPAQLLSPSWTCVAGAGANCPASGSGTVDALVSLEAGASVTFTLNVTVQANPEQIVSNLATVAAPPNAPDPNLVNNDSVDVDAIGVYGEGFETENE